MHQRADGDPDVTNMSGSTKDSHPAEGVFFLLLRLPVIIKKQSILWGQNLWSQADIYFHMLGDNLSEKKIIKIK